MVKNALILIFTFGMKLTYCIGYSGLNADLELFYLGIFLLLLIVLFSLKAVKWMKQKVTKKMKLLTKRAVS